MRGGFGCSPCCSPPSDCVVTGPIGYDVLNNSVRGAQQFITPSGGLTLYSATVYLDAGQSLTTASDAVLELWSNTTVPTDDPLITYYKPNALLATFTPPGSVSTAMTFTLPDEPLTGSTRYFLVLYVKARSPQRNLRWQYVFEGEGCVLSVSTSSDDGGANWRPSSLGSPYRYAVN